MKRIILMLGIVAALVVPAAATSASNSGRTVTLKSYDQNLRITMLGWVNGAQGSSEYDTPAAGKKYVSIKLRVTNLSKRTYSDSPSNGVKLQDKGHRSYDSTIAGPEPQLNHVRILPHDWEIGWITFEIPRTAKPRLFSFTLNSGFADGAAGTGIWRF
jgi:Domain of unknown function (DUF4352)